MNPVVERLPAGLYWAELCFPDYGWGAWWLAMRGRLRVLQVECLANGVYRVAFELFGPLSWVPMREAPHAGPMPASERPLWTLTGHDVGVPALALMGGAVIQKSIGLKGVIPNAY